ncbi:MAG: hypothetical protein Q4D31_05135 [Eubacteriales bacterium]|nr:hypothetical protein [Eubacteriales bacterium]
MYYPDAYHYYTPLFHLVLPLLAVLTTVAGGLALYLLFVRRPGDQLHGAAARLHELLSLRTSYAEPLLRALYCVAVVAIALSSLIVLCTQAMAAIALFLVGNLIARLVFEFAMLLLVLCRNTGEIRRQLDRLTGIAPAPAPAPAPAAAPEDTSAQPPQDD